MRNVAEINLNKLLYNAKLIKRRLPDKVKLCAVVKADAYGHGAAVCAATLYKTVDLFAVAIVEEGVQLRQSGIDKDILVLIPAEKKELYTAIKNRLTLTVQSESDVLAIERACAKNKTRAKVHIAVNTGMNRLGADDNELLSLCSALKKCKYVFAEGVFSHYACPENDGKRKRALKRFNMAVAVVRRVNPDVIRHISASGGFIKGDYLDMVRIGILLYGYKPFKSDFPVKPIMKVKSRAVAKRTVKKGELAGYGETPVGKNTTFTVVRAGYADGLIRRKGKGLINNRCMDTSLIEGDFDGFIVKDADELADHTGTISYEVLCTCTTRADKKYIR